MRVHFIYICVARGVRLDHHCLFSFAFEIDNIFHHYFQLTPVLLSGAASVKMSSYAEMHKNVKVCRSVNGQPVLMDMLVCTPHANEQ
jgi:hypothetical protein